MLGVRRLPALTLRLQLGFELLQSELNFAMLLVFEYTTVVHLADFFVDVQQLVPQANDLVADFLYFGFEVVVLLARIFNSLLTVFLFFLRLLDLGLVRFLVYADALVVKRGSAAIPLELSSDLEHVLSAVFHLARQTFRAQQLLRLRLNLQYELREHVSDVEFTVAHQANIALCLHLVFGSRHRLTATLCSGRVLPRLRPALDTVVVSAERASLGVLVVLDGLSTATTIACCIFLVACLRASNKEYFVVMLVVEEPMLTAR